MTAIQKVLIVGGGTAGWMAAAALAHHLQPHNIAITLVESAEIGTVGVGEATLPGIRDFNSSLGIDEIELIKHTQATFKLGIEFNDWKKPGERFFHPFGSYGAAIGNIPFYQCWLRMRKAGYTSALSDYSFPTQLAKHGRFAQPHSNPPTPLADYHYAFHFDAARYADFLMHYAVKRGVTRLEGKVDNVRTSRNDGHITAVTLESGRTIEADLFIDCSGFRGLLIEGALQTGYEDWSHWLPCNRAVAVQSKSTGAPTPYTRTTAQIAGWQWRIPLQHRVGNGYVFSDRHLTPDDAEQALLESLDGPPSNAPRHFRFVTGRRKAFWNKNCVALGLASGFLEPLESTSISLIQTGIAKLLRFFPWQGFNAAETKEANRLSRIEFERIRDFLILHYKISQRDDSDFWNDCSALSVPDTLAHKIDVFKNRGIIIHYEGESFGDASWLSMYNGFGLVPESCDPAANQITMEALAANTQSMKMAIARAAQQALAHQDFIAQHCKAPEPMATS